jgi:hypothetical protein
MSHGLEILHSHSGLERDLKFPKHTVLIDAKFVHLFHKDTAIAFRYGGIDYFKVNILQFVRNGGVFKNLNS